MSKICSDTFEPQTFAQLEILTNGLARETQSLQKEFQTKFEFLNERHSKIIHNESQLYKIDEAVKRLISNMNSVEDEIQQLECDLQVWKVAINNIELLQGNHFCNCRISFKSEREKFMEMIKETDAKMKQLQESLSDMDMVKKYCIRQPCPYEIIFRILNCHYETLRHTDKQLDLLMDKLLLAATHCPHDSTR